MFKYNEGDQVFAQEINGIFFVCDELFYDCQKYAESLAKIYDEKTDDIALYMLDNDIEAYFGKQSIQTVKESLGKPMIDIGRCTLSYLEHTFDSVHIIEIEFDGLFEKFLCITIDG